MKFKVLVISNNSEVVGGVERAVLNQMNLLTSIGVDTKLFAQSVSNSELPKKMDYFQGGTFRKIINAFNFVYRQESRSKLREVIKSYNPDVIHVHSFEGGISNSMWSLLRNSKARIIFTLHDYGLICGNHRLMNNGSICTKCVNGSKLNIILDKCNRNSLLYSTVNYAHQSVLDYYKIGSIVDTFIAPSNFIQEIYFRKYPNWNVKVIPNSSKVPCSYEKFMKRDKLRRFIYFGRLSAEKGLYEYLEAVSELKENFEFTIVGAGQEAERLKAFHEDKRFRFLDKVDKEDLVKLLNGHDWTVTPSIWYENFPYGIVESYENLKPVLVSRIGGMTEMVEEGKTGFTFNHLSKIEKQKVFLTALNCELEDYLAMQRNISKYLDNISEKKYAMKLFKVYGFDQG
jgi:glycosyltransferase involved in cell wall biosynthesis